MTHRVRFLALVSDPVGLVAAAAPEVAYVSLPPGTIPDGESATMGVGTLEFHYGLPQLVRLP